MTDDHDPEKNRKLKRFAELEVERQSASIDRLLDQHIADFKWLTASLLLLNSGSAVAILNSEFIPVQGKISGVAAYLAGILLALLIGVASQKLAMQMLPAVTGYRAFWIAVSQGEIFDPDSELAAGSLVRSAARFGWVAPTLGWLSAIAFLTGSVLAGLTLEPHKISPVRAVAATAR